jgi:hypothetical protein
VAEKMHRRAVNSGWWWSANASSLAKPILNETLESMS